MIIQQPLRKPKTPDNQRVRRGTKRIFLGASFLLVAALIVIFRQQILDTYVVWRYTPSREVAAIVNRSDLSETGKYYLYASQSLVVDRENFNKECGQLQNEKTVILGCYIVPERRIFIFNVNDTRLDGIMEATAAHEMLHAAYDRLNYFDKQHLDELLLAQEKKITDTRLRQLIELYKESEPGQVINELHSIIGTEVRDISPELESYYGRYFNNRLAVVTMKENYEKIFTNLTIRQDKLVTELNKLAANVTARQKAYQAALTTLNNDINTFNSWADSDEATPNEFSARRAELIQRIDALNAERNTINDLTTTYNTKKAELDSLNLQAETLNQSIDSKLSAPQSL